MEIEIKTILEVGGFCILIMAVIFVIAVLTPKAIKSEKQKIQERNQKQ